jgi:hypothetical protein
MNRCLLKARVYDAEILVRRHVDGGQNVIAGQAKHIAQAFKLERLAD